MEDREVKAWCMVQALAKKIADQEAWRAKYNKEERKKCFVAAGKAEKQNVKRQRVT